MGHKIPLFYYHAAKIAGTVLLNKGIKIEVSKTNSELVDRLAFESLRKTPFEVRFGYKLRPLLPWSIVCSPHTQRQEDLKEVSIDERVYD